MVGWVSAEYDRPYRGRIVAWRRFSLPKRGGYIFWGMFLDDKDKKGQWGYTTKVLEHNTRTGEITTTRARYKLEGAETLVQIQK